MSDTTSSAGTGDDAPPLAAGTDIDGADLDVEADVETPATSDPDEFTEDSDLGGTHGPSAGGAG
jgi:hypothetical protein